jgi:hypothetical protein
MNAPRLASSSPTGGTRRAGLRPDFYCYSAGKAQFAAIFNDLVSTQEDQFMSKDPFHDLHHEIAPDTRHIRLISEGGTSLTRSPEPSCIDSIQVSHTCTTESQHTVYRSATGACTIFSSQDNSLFSIPSELAQELDENRLPAVLRARFEQQRLPLSDAAEISVQHPGRIWFITDQEKRYSVRKLAAHLTVYRDRP